MKVRILLSSLAIALLLAADIWAGTVTLEEAIASAEAANTDLAIARINLETTLRNNSTASSYIPDISIDGSLSLDEMSAFSESWGNLGGTLSLGISLDLGTDLITDGTLKRLERENAAIEYMLSAETLEEAVVSAYWNLALARQAVDSARLAEEDSRDALESIEARYQAGEADELELQEARLELLKYAYERQAYEDQEELAYTAFDELTDIGKRDFDTEPIPNIPQLSLPDAAEFMEQGISGNLTIQSLEKKQKIAVMALAYRFDMVSPPLFRTGSTGTGCSCRLPDRRCTPPGMRPSG